MKDFYPGQYFYNIPIEKEYIETPNLTPFKTPCISPDITPFETPIYSPIITPHNTVDQTPYITPFQSPLQTLQNTPLQTFEKTPELTPFNTMDQSPLFTAMQTIHETPVDTPLDTPFDSPINTPFNTPFDTPFNTPIESPNLTPLYSPLITEENDPQIGTDDFSKTNLVNDKESTFITEESTDKAQNQKSDEVSKTSLVNDEDNAYLTSETEENKNKSIDKTLLIFIIVGSCICFALIIGIIFLGVRIYKHDRSDSSSSDPISSEDSSVNSFYPPKSNVSIGNITPDDMTTQTMTEENGDCENNISSSIYNSDYAKSQSDEFNNNISQDYL